MYFLQILLIIETNRTRCSGLLTGGFYMKGFSLTGFILGIVAAAAGITAVVFGAIGLAKSKPREF